MPEDLLQNVLTLMIISSMIIMIYLKIAKKTFGEFIGDVREAFSSKTEEIIE